MKLSRRTYAILFALLTALFAFAALTSIGQVSRLRVLLVAGFLCSNLYNSSIGGWLGGLVTEEDEGRLGAWFSMSSICGSGTMAILAITLLRVLPYRGGAALVTLLMLLPLLIFRWIPEPEAERRLARESFMALFRDIAALSRRPAVLRTLIIFCLPAASFALTNMLGGLGADFRASERFVGLVAGVGVTFAGAFGSLIVPPLLRRVRPHSLYLLVGGTGALFTRCLLLLPRSPAILAVALIMENVFQSAAFATENKIIFNTIGPGNPIAATQYSVLYAATMLPIAYMQMIDGLAYGYGGMAGSLANDAAISLAACLLLLPWCATGADRPRQRKVYLHDERWYCDHNCAYGISWYRDVDAIPARRIGWRPCPVVLSRPMANGGWREARHCAVK